MKKEKQSNRLIPVRSIVVIFAILIMISSISPAIAAKPLYLVEFDRPGYEVNENDGFVTLNLTLNRTIEYNAFWVFYNTHNGTANNVTNFRSPVNSSYPDPAVVTFSYYPGYPNLFEFIKVPIIDDGMYSPTDKFFFMNLTSFCPDHYGILGSNSNVIITIHESSSRPTVQFATDSYTVNEDDGTASVFVTLSGPASEDVVVNYETRPGTALAGVNYTAVDSSITFPAGSTTPLEIPVTILDDAIYGGDTFFFVNLTGVSSGNADMGSPDATMVTVKEDDPYVVHVYNEWALVSWPVVNNSIKASDLTDNETLGVTIVAIYDPVMQTFKSYTRGDPSIFDFNLGMDMGIFLWGDHNDGFPVYGPFSSPHLITLYPEWNLIGWSSLEQVHASDITDSNVNVQIIARYDVISQSYQSYTVGDPSIFDFIVRDGEGYFVKSAGSEPVDFLTGGINIV